MCINNSSCGCHLSRCRNLGPFLAVDADCNIPPAPSLLRSAGIIPFSSGGPVALLTVTSGASTPALIGFGSSVLSPTILSNTITLTSVLNEAFSVPRVGTITSISASFIAAAGITLTTGSTVTVRAQIWRAPAGTNVYSPTSAFVDLAPSLSGLLSVLVPSEGSSDTFPPVPLAVGDRLVMMISTTQTGPLNIVALTGSVSAGITIE
ncbi:exosporium glycoprotein BclB-related protein [Psychrobacillus soli]|uniref:BclB domain-containing protein n=1 Tax=Psychrobacillus soli TaxID=1543965 RepID=A0A544TLX5_9BACI|nr:exosporium glycoprotein BclB-related protein [Psychrobacillus soli]TQR18457.1 hypothetical protein FG383_00970 [Psychrobacillus soli]